MDEISKYNFPTLIVGLVVVVVVVVITNCPPLSLLTVWFSFINDKKQELDGSSFENKKICLLNRSFYSYLVTI
jgi:hypothetical protein